jgi:tripartite-type tricarboxylate transporter receptor subunit TctC
MIVSMRIRHQLALLTIVATAFGVATAAHADEVSFQGKTITVYIGAPPGGGYDLYGRLVSQFIGKHIPGQPAVIASNRPGASGFVMSQWLYNVAPKDGTALGTVPQNAPTEQALGNKAAKFQSDKFVWIGRLNSNVPVQYVWHDAPVRSIADMKTTQIVAGADSATSTQATNPKLLNLLAGTKFKIVTGYTGGSEVRLAIERGEVQSGVAPLALFRSELADWLKDGKVRLLVQYGPDRHPAFPDVPSSVELGDTEEARQILRFFVNDSAIGRAIAAPPGLSVGATTVLRRAFDAMIQDPDFIAETTKRKIEIDPLSGEKLQKVVAEALAVSPQILEKAKAAARAVGE